MFSLFRKKTTALFLEHKQNLWPSKIRLEASSLCQLKCPACINTTGQLGIIDKGYLTFLNFTKFIKQHPYIRTIELSNFGEIFLNPDLENILAHAYSENITLEATNGVNFNTVSPELLEALVRYRFNKISISIDGASQETYSKYRIGGKLDTVLHNIQCLNSLKKRYRSKLPRLTWQFVVFGYNEHEIEKARTLARKYGAQFKLKLNYLPNYSPIKNPEILRKLLGAATRTEYEEKHHRAYLLPCYQLWRSPQINWDGKLLGCCVNSTTDFGNVFASSLENCLQGELFVYTKKMLLGLVPPKKEIHCTNCSFFQTFKLFITE